MKALTYHGPYDVRIENVPDPTLQEPDDLLLRVTATAICGSDLHLYRGVPRANSGPLRVPEALPDEKVLFLSDILPTGYKAAVNAKIEKGSSVAIFGAGPVGYMTAACARMLGAERIFMIDHHDYRLDFAASAYGGETIHFERQPDPARRIIAATGGRGVDASIDAVGFEASGCPVDSALVRLKIQGSSGHVVRQAIAATRRGGTVSVAGVYGGWIHAFLFGDAFEKGLHFAMGPTHVQRDMPALLEHVARGDLTPDVIITHHLALEEAPHGYRIFDKKQENCRKVVMTPHGPARGPV